MVRVALRYRQISFYQRRTVKIAKIRPAKWVQKSSTTRTFTTLKDLLSLFSTLALNSATNGFMPQYAQLLQRAHGNPHVALLLDPQKAIRGDLIKRQISAWLQKEHHITCEFKRKKRVEVDSYSFLTTVRRVHQIIQNLPQDTEMAIVLSSFWEIVSFELGLFSNLTNPGLIYILRAMKQKDLAELQKIFLAYADPFEREEFSYQWSSQLQLSRQPSVIGKFNSFRGMIEYCCDMPGKKMGGSWLRGFTKLIEDYGRNPHIARMFSDEVGFLDKNLRFEVQQELAKIVGYPIRVNCPRIRPRDARQFMNLFQATHNFIETKKKNPQEKISLFQFWHALSFYMGLNSRLENCNFIFLFRDFNRQQLRDFWRIIRQYADPIESTK